MDATSQANPPHRAGHSLIGRTLPLPDGRALRTHEAIHTYPGKRLLAKGALVGETVVAKCYFGRWRGWPEWRRGVRGARALEAADLPCPAVLFAGWLPAARAWLLVLEYIQPDRPWPPTGRPDEDVHRLTLETLARHHQAGIVQNDLNWTNFLPAGGRLYTLDSDRIRNRLAPLGIRRSLHNLARFYAYKSDFRAIDIAHGLRTYHQLRGWALPPERQRRFLQTVYRRRMRVARGVARRSLRGWKYYEKSFVNHCFLLVDRRRIRPELFREHVSDLVEGNRENRGVDVAGIGLRAHFVNGHRRMPGTDAVTRAWMLAVMLRRLRIPAELPAAMIRWRQGLFTVAGVVLTVARAAEPLGRYPADREHTRECFGQIVEIIARLHLAGLSHPGLQPESFGMTATGEVVLVDWRAIEPSRRTGDPGSDVHRVADALGVAPEDARNALESRLPS